MHEDLKSRVREIRDLHQRYDTASVCTREVVRVHGRDSADAKASMRLLAAAAGDHGRAVEALLKTIEGLGTGLEACAQDALDASHNAAQEEAYPPGYPTAWK